MTETRPLARQLLRVVLGTPDAPDRDLLARFVASRDEDAFAELVRRHGPMVLATCRRVTGRPHDADDAFQAAFLVLARRAGHIDRPELLANWLYGVAYRTALEARAARRRSEEHVVPAAPEPAAPTPPDDTTDLRRIIDEELARLPDKYRAAVVLCDLEGLPRAAAAAQLGIPEGTLSSRLAHARKVLAGRLARRGVTAGSAAALGRDVAAVVVPNNLTHTTVRAAVRFVPGAASPPGVSPAVSSLTDGALKTMLATRLRQLFAVGLLACGLTGVGTVLAQQFGAPPVAEPHALPAATDPFAPAGAPPKRSEPKKVAAKGIEDDDVPYGTFPAQAVVRIEEGKLIVRQRTRDYTQTTNGTTTVRQFGSHVVATAHDPADVSVFDMKGNRLAPKAWKETFKADVHALVSADGSLPNPRELALFKQDTLLIVLPAAPAPPPTLGRPAFPTGWPNLTPQFSVPSAPAPVVRPPQSVRPPIRVVPQTVPPVSTAPPGERLPPATTPPINEPLPILPPDTTTPAPSPPTEVAISGSVLKVEGDLIEVSFGPDAGLKVGTQMGVSRATGPNTPSAFLGELTVQQVEKKRVVGRFTPLRAGVAVDKLDADELPRPGDTVYFVPGPAEVPGPTVGGSSY